MYRLRRLLSRRVALPEERVLRHEYAESSLGWLHILIILPNIAVLRILELCVNAVITDMTLNIELRQEKIIKNKRLWIKKHTTGLLQSAIA